MGMFKRGETQTKKLVLELVNILATLKHWVMWVKFRLDVGDGIPPLKP